MTALLERSHRPRPRVLGALTTAVALVALAACGAPATEAPADGAGTAGETRSIEHIYGSTEVPADPQRVVALGYTDVDYLLALGIVPVAYNDWFGTEPTPFYLPWQNAAANGAESTPLSLLDGVPLEQVAEADPDLIVATDTITQEEYDLLSQIAPTVGPLLPPEEYGAPWQELTTRTASIFGLDTEGQQLVEELEGRFEEARTEHPEFAGATITYADTTTYSPYFPQDPRIDLFRQLGFTLSQGVEQAEQNTTDTTGYSPENLYLLDADVFIAQSYDDETRLTAEADPAFANLDVSRRGDVLWPSEDTTNAIVFGSVLSIPYALDGIVPSLSTELTD